MSYRDPVGYGNTVDPLQKLIISYESFQALDCHRNQQADAQQDETDDNRILEGVDEIREEIVENERVEKKYIEEVFS